MTVVEPNITVPVRSKLQPWKSLTAPSESVATGAPDRNVRHTTLQLIYLIIVNEAYAIQCTIPNVLQDAEVSMDVF
jgi:hypothetical protein